MNELFKRNCAVMAEWYAGNCARELQCLGAEGDWLMAEGTNLHGIEYRLKPITVTVNGIEVPEPVREPLKDHQEFWLVQITTQEGARQFEWHGGATDFRSLERGLIHLTEDAARQHFEALIAPTRTYK